MLAADYPFLDVMWTIFIFFAWIIFIWLLIMVLADNFRRNDHSGWAKAGWTLFVIFLPFLGVFSYLIARGDKIGEHQYADAQPTGPATQPYVT